LKKKFSSILNKISEFKKLRNKQKLFKNKHNNSINYFMDNYLNNNINNNNIIIKNIYENYNSNNKRKNNKKNFIKSNSFVMPSNEYFSVLNAREYFFLNDN